MRFLFGLYFAPAQYRARGNCCSKLLLAFPIVLIRKTFVQNRLVSRSWPFSPTKDAKICFYCVVIIMTTLSFMNSRSTSYLKRLRLSGQTGIYYLARCLVSLRRQYQANRWIRMLVVIIGFVIFLEIVIPVLIYAKYGYNVKVLDRNSSKFFVYMNAITIFLFGLDKLFSIVGATRISNNSLKVWIALGGTFGAFIAMELFRHKISKKLLFRDTVKQIAIFQAVSLCFLLGFFVQNRFLNRF